MFEIYTSESVTDGHPDKLADQISDAIVDRVLSENPNGAAAVDTYLCGNTVILTGAISGGLTFEPCDVAEEIIVWGGYLGLSADSYRSLDIVSRIYVRERDIAEYFGPSPGRTIYGYACDETPELMPLPTILAHQLAGYLTKEVRSTLTHMRAQCSVQVSVEYVDSVLHRIRSVFISAPYQEGINKKLFVREAKYYLQDFKFVDADTKIVAKVYGESDADPKAKIGFTGRRLDVDTYGGFTRNVGTTFLGRTPCLGDRAAACMARYIAKNIVAAGLAKRCEVALPYVQGINKPLCPVVNTFGGSRDSDGKLSKLVATHFNLSRKGSIRTLDMNRPIYRRLAAYGCFGRDDPDFRWEETDAAEILRRDSTPVSGESK